MLKLSIWQFSPTRIEINNNKHYSRGCLLVSDWKSTINNRNKINKAPITTIIILIVFYISYICSIEDYQINIYEISFFIVYFVYGCSISLKINHLHNKQDIVYIVYYCLLLFLPLCENAWICAFVIFDLWPSCENELEPKNFLDLDLALYTIYKGHCRIQPGA